MWSKKAKNTRFDFVAKFTNFMIFKRDNPKSDSGILGRKRLSKIDQFLMKIKRNLRKNPLVVTVTADGVTSTDEIATVVNTTVKQHVGADGQIVTERTPMFTSPQNLDKG